jgi:hypothetical protein
MKSSNYSYNLAHDLCNGREKEIKEEKEICATEIKKKINERRKVERGRKRTELKVEGKRENGRNE